jgi:hypothetical protein
MFGLGFALDLLDEGLFNVQGTASITPSATGATRHDASILDHRLPLVL